MVGRLAKMNVMYAKLVIFAVSILFAVAVLARSENAVLH